MAVVMVRVAASKAMEGVWYWDAFLMSLSTSQIMWIGGNGDDEWITVPELPDIFAKLFRGP